MALLPRKPDLLGRVERALQAGGWNVLYLTGPGEHPARYRIEKDGTYHTLKVYIWNVTHGGGNRNVAEYRIQITGINPQQFIPEITGKTLILGYWTAEDVFAGFDYSFHDGPLGGSASLQIGEQALLGANQQRFAMHEKGNGELAVAFMPDFLGSYVDNLAALHATGQVPAEVDLLARLAADPAAVPQAEIDATIASHRQFAITKTRRALRALDFRSRVLTAYSHRCAMCSVQLRLVDGAHILPVSEPASTDETANGIALCALHHRAYDRGLLTFDGHFRTHINDLQVQELTNSGLDGGIAAFGGAVRHVIHLPASVLDRPNPAFVAQANSLRGWTFR
ncbi:MAG TPA: HNH endonuclease [Mesorhizobium sp.]|jgi:putative restriction endonuclease|nr:HNH endonuclease [Mesorhizobium sp.]